MEHLVYQINGKIKTTNAMLLKTTHILPDIKEKAERTDSKGERSRDQKVFGRCISNQPFSIIRGGFIPSGVLF